MTEKPHMLLWIDVETTGLDPSEDQLLEIGMICTTLDAKTEDSRLVETIRPDKPITITTTNLKAIGMHADNGLLEQALSHDASHKADAQRHAADFINDLADKYTLHPAGTNPQFDIRFIDGQLTHTLRGRCHWRTLDLTAFRLADTALGDTPYNHHETTHRCADCLKRDIHDYRAYLDRMGAER